MDAKNPFNESRKLRRRLLNARNQERSSSGAGVSSKKRDLEKDSLLDLSKKDNKSGRGRYV